MTTMTLEEALTLIRPSAVMFASAAWDAVLTHIDHLREQASARDAIIQHCVVTEAVTPDESDWYTTISRVIDYHVGLEAGR